MSSRPRPRVVLIVPTATYRASDFIAAARALDVELVVASDEEPVLGGDRAIALALDDPPAAVDALQALDDRRGVDAVVAVDDHGVEVAALAGARLGFPHNPPDAVRATRDKAEMRARLARAEVPQPTFGAGGSEVGYPCVVKPTGLSGSRGVIRCDDADQEAEARARIARFWDGPVLAERFVPGVEVALEGLLRDGRLTVLAVFDKPDPLDGPYFEETLYITPSRLPRTATDAVEQVSARAAAAIGLTEGPVHAEVRWDGERAWVIEVAARSIGGLCARTLRFGAGISLEEVVLRHALGSPIDDLRRETQAAGVMMLPIPRAGRLVAIHGQDRALAVPHVVGLDITVPIGRRVVPVPEGDRYLGFLFARAATPDAVEHALREAAGRLDIVIG